MVRDISVTNFIAEAESWIRRVSEQPRLGVHILHNDADADVFALLTEKAYFFQRIPEFAMMDAVTISPDEFRTDIFVVLDKLRHERAVYIVEGRNAIQDVLLISIDVVDELLGV